MYYAFKWKETAFKMNFNQEQILNRNNSLWHTKCFYYQESVKIRILLKSQGSGCIKFFEIPRQSEET